MDPVYRGTDFLAYVGQVKHQKGETKAILPLVKHGPQRSLLFAKRRPLVMHAPLRESVAQRG